jgi:phosphoglucomutase
VNDSAIQLKTISCAPFRDQRPGTAGLRKKVTVFQQPHYLETFVQSVFDVLQLPRDATLVIGGDGRYYNRTAVQTIIRMAIANGARHLVVGQGGLLSTPAASHLIRHCRAQAGFLLTASHNPGGPAGDFGIKFNVASGGQAPEALTEAVYQASLGQSRYRLADLPDADLDTPGSRPWGPATLQVVDPSDDWSALMQTLFDFGQMQAWLKAGHRVRFDALHGITGPYARRVFLDLLDAPAGSLARCEPLPDFGGLHPDPNPVEAADLVRLAMGNDSPDLLAASDGDGDRNMILGPGTFVSPGDSVALLLAHLDKMPGYRCGLAGAARSMPTSRALDAVAAHRGIPCYETPTGWRFFCNLLEAGKISVCGEESFGTSSSHAREKDGLWAVLAWLNVLAVTGQSVGQLLQQHWQQFGRHHYQRWDYDIADSDAAADLMAALRDLLPALQGSNPAGGIIETADDFSYRDPVDGSESHRQGIRLIMGNGTRIVYRLSGTGTSGATLRVYLERFVRESADINLGTGAAVGQLGAVAAQIARISHFAGLSAPTARI